jgi:hypothetical protein
MLVRWRSRLHKRTSTIAYLSMKQGIKKACRLLRQKLVFDAYWETLAVALSNPLHSITRAYLLLQPLFHILGQKSGLNSVQVALEEVALVPAERLV